MQPKVAENCQQKMQKDCRKIAEKIAERFKKAQRNWQLIYNKKSLLNLQRTLQPKIKAIFQQNLQKIYSKIRNKI